MRAFVVDSRLIPCLAPRSRPVGHPAPATGASSAMYGYRPYCTLVCCARSPIVAGMAAKKPPAKRAREPMPGRRLYRESVYLHEDEMAAVEAEARRQRCSRAEILRRTVRAYFKIED